MKDPIGAATIAGIIGTIIMDFLSYILIVLGIPMTSPWNIAADVFLSWSQVNSPIGIFLGIVGTAALGIGTAILLVIVMKMTGKDFTVLKGIIVATAVGFASMGLFMPLLNIAPQIQSQPLTNLFALIILTIFGVIVSFILKKYGTFVKN
ncbi:hypothetical protein [Dehalobacter sp. TeCB1]|uniref:hypothetical protein n=1 Tax=Dehalobacter sp. TeCB1 TaxID=1843715 RepID=UPI00083AE282|nr:hypothetical protein [Dehalobacter sp. TeCB1]OCZ49864.1 hypothetical protein A7D23_00510 [Dehalobacter sp. TeCB1]